MHIDFSFRMVFFVAALILAILNAIPVKESKINWLTWSWICFCAAFVFA